jgi:hypothetical protein
VQLHRGVEVLLHSFFTPAPDTGEWSPLRPGEGQSVLICRKVGKAAGQSGHVRKRRHLFPVPGIERGSYGYPAHCIVTVLTELFQFEIVWFFKDNVTTTDFSRSVEIADDDPGDL